MAVYIWLKYIKVMIKRDTVEQLYDLTPDHNGDHETVMIEAKTKQWND